MRHPKAERAAANVAAQGANYRAAHAASQQAAGANASGGSKGKASGPLGGSSSIEQWKKRVANEQSKLAKAMAAKSPPTQTHPKGSGRGKGKGRGEPGRRNAQHVQPKTCKYWYKTGTCHFGEKC